MFLQVLDTPLRLLRRILKQLRMLQVVVELPLLLVRPASSLELGLRTRKPGFFQTQRRQFALCGILLPENWTRSAGEGFNKINNH